jgi:hypothetical protein
MTSRFTPACDNLMAVLFFAGFPVAVADILSRYPTTIIAADNENPIFAGMVPDIVTPMLVGGGYLAAIIIWQRLNHRVAFDGALIFFRGRREGASAR